METGGGGGEVRMGVAEGTAVNVGGMVAGTAVAGVVGVDGGKLDGSITIVGKTAVGAFVGKTDAGSVGSSPQPHKASPINANSNKRPQTRRPAPFRIPNSLCRILFAVLRQHRQHPCQIIIPIHIIIIWQQHGYGWNTLQIKPVGAVAV